MVYLPIYCDVVAEIILGHQATAYVHPDLLQVRVVNDAVSIQAILRLRALQESLVSFLKPIQPFEIT